MRNQKVPGFTKICIIGIFPASMICNKDKGVGEKWRILRFCARLKPFFTEKLLFIMWGQKQLNKERKHWLSVTESWILSVMLLNAKISFKKQV
jgi:hypothetical protein